MIIRKMLGTAIAGIALGIASLPLASTSFAAPPVTNGLVALSLQGVGTGTLSEGVPACGSGLTCETADCGCLQASETLVGNQGFNKFTLSIRILIDLSDNTLFTATFGNCYAATGLGIISNPGSKNGLDVNISGLACSTLSGTEVFNGTYLVTNGTGKYSASSGGTGAINGSQTPTTGVVGISQVAITGSLQPVVPSP